MKSIRFLSCLAAGTVAFSSIAANAATLQVVSGPLGTRAVTINAFQPLGQSFTAIDSSLNSFGFLFESLNPTSANAPITFSLLAGAGLGGSALYTTTFTLPTSINGRTPTWYDFGIAANVVVGQQYTAVLTTTSNRNAVSLGPDYNVSTGQFGGGDAYSGGQAYFSNSAIYANCQGTANNCDLNFRVTGTTAAAVPEPASWAMMITGFGAVGFGLRRRRATTALA
ncbi:MAG: PEPxxWA-CTERM sorting domain-containing protein [Sphingomonadales bacterium]